MTTAIIIPARMQSARLPGKPLADIAGLPMIVHVWQRAVDAACGDVVVACAEQEIADVVRKACGTAVLTRADHPSGSDRIFEAASSLAAKPDIIINLQGDLPTLDPALIRTVADVLTNTGADIATLAAPIHDEEERTNPNVVKVAMTGEAAVGAQGRALYFSRATIPHGPGLCLHHIGIYAYRYAALEQFVALPPSSLEKRERLEQLRALEAGMRIGVGVVDTVPVGVDTPEDLDHVRTIIAKEHPHGEVT